MVQTSDDEIVQLPAATVAIEDGVFFSVICKTCGEICSNAVTSEKSVSEKHIPFVYEADCIHLMIRMIDGPSKDTECASENQLQE